MRILVSIHAPVSGPRVLDQEKLINFPGMLGKYTISNSKDLVVKISCLNCYLRKKRRKGSEDYISKKGREGWREKETETVRQTER